MEKGKPRGESEVERELACQETKSPGKSNLPGQGKRILIVDDSEITIKLLAAQIEDKGFEILEAETVNKAIRIVLDRQTRPDLILLDIHMEEVDGGEFCRFVKGQAGLKGIKVVFCSGMEESELKAMVEICGADGYVCKSDLLGSWVVSELA